MKKAKKLLAICLTTMLSLGILAAFPTQVYAYQSISNSTKATKLFAVPEGGWSSITAKVDYYEYYSPNGSNNNFKKRDATVVYSTAAATSTPYVTLGNVKHSNGKYYRSWNSISIMYGSDWSGGFGKENTDSVTYTATTSVTGKLAFLLSCNGGVPASYANSVDLDLNTK